MNGHFFGWIRACILLGDIQETLSASLVAIRELCLLFLCGFKRGMK